MKKLIIAAFGALLVVAPAKATIVYFEDFEANWVDQAPLVATNGNASVSFGANDEIGDTNGAGDGEAGGIYSSVGTGTALSTRNGTRGYFASPASGFTLAGGNGVGQLHSHTSGGFGTLSVGPVTTIGGVNNQPTPIALALAEGDIIRVTFDLFVQANGTDNSGGINWNAKDSLFNVIATPGQDSWNEFHTGTIGTEQTVVKELVVDAAMVSSGIASVGPQFGFHNNAGNMAFNTAYAQIDNFKVEHIAAIPEPASLALVSLGALGLLARRRFR